MAGFIPGSGSDTQRAVSGAAEIGTGILTGDAVAVIAGAVQEAIAVIPLLISAFSGVPKNQKTIQTGQRLLTSSNQALQLLGLFWYKAGQLGVVDSSPPDITTYFTPAYNYTISTLNIPFASPLWYSLAGIIGEGQSPALFDQQFKEANLAKPMYVTQTAWNILYPGQRFPAELDLLYRTLAQDFVNPAPPPPGGQPGGPPPPPPPPPPGGQNGNPPPIDQACCAAIVAALTAISAELNSLPNLGDLASLPAAAAALAAILPQVTVIANAINTLLAGSGQELGGLITAIGAIGQALGTTITTAAGEEVSAIQAVSTALVNTLTKIDIDTENSLAGVAHAIGLIDFSKLIDAISACCKPIGAALEKNQPLWDQMVRDGLVDRNAGQLADPWPFDQLMAAIGSVAKYLGGEAGLVESGLGKLFVNVIEPWVRKAFGLAESEASSFISTVERLADTYGKPAISFFSTLISKAAPIAEALPASTLTLALDVLKAGGPITPENSEAAGFKTLTLAFVAGQLIHLAAGAAGYLGYPMSSLWGHNATITVDALGYEEILRQVHRSFFPNAFGRSQNYYYQKQFRPLLPDLGRSLEFFARRLISHADLDSLLAYNGINAAWAPAMIEASYRPIQPRALAAVIGEYQFDRSKVTELLQYGGMRDQDIDLMIEALTQRGLQTLRQALINETVTLAGQGLLTDQDVASTLHTVNLSDDAINLINQRIALLRLHNLAALTKTELTAAAKAEEITLDDYSRDLSALGYQDAEVQIFRNTVDQFLSAKHEKAAARELSLEEARIERITLRQAQQAYKRGEISAATFGAELAAAGMSADQIAAYTALAVVSNEPTLRAGSKLSAAAAKQQSAKLAVKALSEEYKKGALDEPTLRQGLAANAMSPADIDATVAYLNALVLKKPAAPAVTVPLAS